MPRIKRWFHASQDLNRDPEFREFSKKFGLAGVRFWLEALAILDRTDNYWDLKKEFDLGLLAGTCETKRHIIQRSLEHLKDINWLRVGIDPDQKSFIYAPKWSEYNQRREDKGSMLDTTRNHESTHPTPSPTPSPKGKIKKKSKVVLEPPQQQNFDKFWAIYPRKVAKDAAIKAWNELNPDDSLVATILDSVERQKQADQPLSGSVKFIPHPATWLNGKRWTDETKNVQKPQFDWKKNV